MAEPLSGVLGSVRVNGLAVPGDKWTANFDQQVVDRSNFNTQGEPSNARGQRTGEISLEGPYEGPMGIDRGNLYDFTLSVVSGLLFLVVTGRVSNITFSNDKDQGPRFSIRAAQYGPIKIARV